MFCAASVCVADELIVSAQVDQTTVEVGTPIQLTITLRGDVEGIQLPAVEFPEGFAVSARSQSSSVVVKGGVVERSVSLVYALVPQQAGTFTLGPFHLEHKGRTIPTAPIQVTVEKPAIAPSLGSSGPRYSL